MEELTEGTYYNFAVGSSNIVHRNMKFVGYNNVIRSEYDMNNKLIQKNWLANFEHMSRRPLFSESDRDRVKYIGDTEEEFETILTVRTNLIRLR